MKILEFDSSILEYLKRRQILKQYLKVKNNLIDHQRQSAKFKKRRPFSQNRYYFRINDKYRAIGKFKDNVFIVAEISKHQEK